MIVFGGWGEGQRHLNDLYRFNPQTNVWTRINPTGHVPPPRSGHSCILHGDRMIIFGGWGGEAKSQMFLEQYWDDCYQLDLLTMHWSEVEASGDFPEERSGHSATVYNNAMYIYGGFAGGTYFKDIIALDLETNVWTRKTCSGDAPERMYGHSAFIHGNKMVVFGGYRGGLSVYLNDIRYLNLDTFEWSLIADRSSHHVEEQMSGKEDVEVPFQKHKRDKRDITQFASSFIKRSWVTDQKFSLPDDFLWGAGGSKRQMEDYGDKRVLEVMPSPRYQHASTLLNPDTYFIWGGYFDGFHLNDAWKLDLSEWKWEKVNSALGGPSDRDGYSFAEANKKIVVFGGIRDWDTYFNQVYSLDISSL